MSNISITGVSGRIAFGHGADPIKDVIIIRIQGMYFMIWAAMSDNVPTNICVLRRFRAVFAFAQSDQNPTGIAKDV